MEHRSWLLEGLMDVLEYGIQDKKVLLFLWNQHQLKVSNLIAGLSHLEMLIIQRRDASHVDMITVISKSLI